VLIISNKLNCFITSRSLNYPTLGSQMREAVQIGTCCGSMTILMWWWCFPPKWCSCCTSRSTTAGIEVTLFLWGWKSTRQGWITQSMFLVYTGRPTETLTLKEFHWTKVVVLALEMWSNSKEQWLKEENTTMGLSVISKIIAKIILNCMVASNISNVSIPHRDNF